MEFQVKAYDPKGMNEAKKCFGDSIKYTENMYDALSDVNCVIIITEWEEFSTIDWNIAKNQIANPLVIDLRNLYKQENMKANGLKYISLGKKSAI